MKTVKISVGEWTRLLQEVVVVLQQSAHVHTPKKLPYY
jgi:hypothetical protein